MNKKTVVVALISLFEILATPAATLYWRLKLPPIILDERAAIIQKGNDSI